MRRKEKILEGLFSANREGRLHHSYILGGPESSQKEETVFDFMTYFDAGKISKIPDEFFSKSRRRASDRTHPDFLFLSPKEGVITVDEVRSLPRALAYAPLENSRRAVLIENAKCLNVQASNALLKILEEPPAHTMFFIFCRDPSDLLPTIVSRSQVLRFAPLSDDDLLSDLNYSGDNQELLLALSSGSAERAKFLVDKEGALSLATKACEHLVDLWKVSPRVPSSAFQWLETISTEEDWQIVVDSWSLLVRDLLFVLRGATSKALYFSFFFSALEDIVDKGGKRVFDEASSKAEVINRFRVYREFNGSLKLGLAALLSELQIISIGKA